MHSCDSLRGLEETPILLLHTEVVGKGLGRPWQGLCSGAYVQSCFFVCLTTGDPFLCPRGEILTDWGILKPVGLIVN